MGKNNKTKSHYPKDKKKDASKNCASKFFREIKKTGYAFLTS